MDRKTGKKARTATIIFVGSGPGDPELITVKGMKALKEADIVIYAGSLVKEKALKYCPKRAAVYNSANMNLGEITSIMAEGARAGKRVVRLHSGDPSLYGALREQADFLDKEGIPYEVIPGVSSAFAAAAALKKELTLPGVTQTVIFTRIEGRTPVPPQERLSSLSMHNSTICIFLSVAMIDKVVRELKKGYPTGTPAAVVYRASWKDERIIRGTLKDIAKKVKDAGIKRHALIIAGRAVGEGTESGVPLTKSLLYDKDFTHGFRGPGRRPAGS